jgi:hypothetical protein
VGVVPSKTTPTSIDPSFTLSPKTTTLMCYVQEDYASHKPSSMRNGGVYAQAPNSQWIKRNN